MKLGHTWDWNPGLLGKRPVCDRPSHPRIPLFFLFILLCNCSIILRSVGQLTRLLYIQCIQPPPPHNFFLSHSRDHCCNLMKQSTAACLASGVQSALLCVLPSQWAIWKEKCPCSMAWMLSENIFLPPRGARLPHSSFPVLSFLSPSLSLS